MPIALLVVLCSGVYLQYLITHEGGQLIWGIRKAYTGADTQVRALRP